MTNPEVSVVPTREQIERKAFETIQHSIRQARIPGNDWKRELALIENVCVEALAHQTPPAAQPSATVGEVIGRAREAAALAFDARARKAKHPDVATLERHHAKVIRQGEGDDYDAVQAARIALERAATLHTPPPVATATVVDEGLREALTEAEWAISWCINEHDAPNTEREEAALAMVRREIAIFAVDAGEVERIVEQKAEAISAACNLSLRLAAALEALRWYAEQVGNCRKNSSEGDAARYALDKDAGERALAVINTEGRKA